MRAVDAHASAASDVSGMRRPGAAAATHIHANSASDMTPGLKLRGRKRAVQVSRTHAAMPLHTHILTPPRLPKHTSHPYALTHLRSRAPAPPTHLASGTLTRLRSSASHAASHPTAPARAPSPCAAPVLSAVWCAGGAVASSAAADMNRSSTTGRGAALRTCAPAGAREHVVWGRLAGGET